MTITLYNNTSPNNKINKVLTNSTQLTGDFREETGLISPVFRVEGMQNRSFNYAYIPDFNRYYYITGYSSLGHNILELQLKVDVLMSYKTDIYATTGYVERASLNTATQPDVDDGMRISKAGLTDTVIEYNSSISPTVGAVILLTVGEYFQAPASEGEAS